jgi:hypothetical protein
MFSRESRGKDRIAMRTKLDKRAAAWTRRVSSVGRTIHWRLTRAKARVKFGYEPVKACEG